MSEPLPIPTDRIRPVFGPWASSLVDLVSSARVRLLLCAPYVSAGGVAVVRRGWKNPPLVGSASTILTDLSPLSVYTGATDPLAVADLLDLLNGARVIHLPRLHAKVYCADGSRAVVTSGNLTAGGLSLNHEYGLTIEDPNLARKIEQDVVEYASLGGHLQTDTLARYCEVARDVRAAGKAELESASAPAKRRLSLALQEAETQLLTARLGGGPLHTVFARTITYILGRSGAMTTNQLHTRIQEIHPDLCDDAVERVIDGKRFGKKWKHAVRTAQQQLKKSGGIELVEGVWRSTQNA